MAVMQVDDSLVGLEISRFILHCNQKQSEKLRIMRRDFFPRGHNYS